MFITDAETGVPLSRPALRELYGLSRCEAETAAVLAEGKSVAEAAESMEVSMNTVRAHLKRLFVKTGTSRQSELMLLLSHGLASLPLGMRRE